MSELTWNGETWRQVKDFPNYYVSAGGQVLSVAYGMPRLRQLKQRRNGYLEVAMCNHMKVCYALVHRQVLTLWCREPTQGEQGRHLNGNPLDCRIMNLAWGTPKDNASDRRRHGTMARGDRSGNHKLTVQQVQEIRQRIEYESTRQLAAAYGVDRRSITFVVRGMTWNYLQGSPQAPAPPIEQERLPYHKLRPNHVVEIRASQGHESAKVLAMRFGVTPGNIQAIWYRGSWSRVKEVMAAGE